MGTKTQRIATPEQYREAVKWVRQYATGFPPGLSGIGDRGWRTPAQFTVACGRPFRPRPCPSKVYRGTPRYCFHNCHKVARAYPERWLYAEGLAVTPQVPFPFPHAMIVNRRTNLAHEITLPKEVPLAFFAVVLTEEFRAAEFREGCRYDNVNITDQWERGWPLLKLSAPELAAVLISLPDPDPDEEA